MYMLAIYYYAMCCDIDSMVSLCIIVWFVIIFHHHHHYFCFFVTSHSIRVSAGPGRCSTAGRAYLVSLYPYLLARKYKECDCILSSIVYHRDYLVVISHILSRKLHTHTIKHTLSLTFLSLSSSGYTRTRLVALTTRPLLYLITITHYTFTYRFRG